jgi:hypothetical protein
MPRRNRTRRDVERQSRRALPELRRDDPQRRCKVSEVRQHRLVRVSRTDDPALKILIDLLGGSIYAGQSIAVTDKEALSIIECLSVMQNRAIVNVMRDPNLEPKGGVS